MAKTLLAWSRSLLATSLFFVLGLIVTTFILILPAVSYDGDPIITVAMLTVGNFVYYSSNYLLILLLLTCLPLAAWHRKRSGSLPLFMAVIAGGGASFFLIALTFIISTLAEFR